MVIKLVIILKLHISAKDLKRKKEEEEEVQW